MKHVLLVDNDLLFTRTVSYLLEKELFTVTTAKDGKEAADALAGKHFDLVVTDLFMPYSNGFELVNTIRSTESLKHTPVMVVSDVSNKQSISNCFRLGANVYLQKPLNVPLLLSEIKNLVLNQQNVAA